ncbi:MAG: 2'-deoxycytidine 5'-triphosphate deaminase [Parcubacteria group bacterium]|nr:2'-deoxycytidine 5'-triphosphate deaminase [Parcubacteria group bacterium]MCR4342470.1 2'-deoxycytidine 5'-triphosphate deaminase [Patescibacteria group bacterium]
MVLSFQDIKRMISGQNPIILSDIPFAENQIQPSTIDCRLGNRVYRMSTAMIPRREESIAQLIDKYKLYEFELREGSVLEKGASYIIPLLEKLNLPDELNAIFSPKSSTGRVDVFCRVLVDGNPHYDITESGYSGNLYLEVSPQSFSVGITPGLALVQMRIRQENVFLSDDDLKSLQKSDGIIYNDVGKDDNPVIKNNSTYLHVDLLSDVVGFEAKDNSGKYINLFKKDFYEADDFWIPIKRPKNGELILTPGRFYLLASKERIRIPSSVCAEVEAYDLNFGEFRTHYAGFFDNGFGGDDGTRAVLEVRVHDVPFRICDNQPICRMTFEKTKEVPEMLYGKDLNSNYVSNKPSLSKHFKNRLWY